MPSSYKISSWSKYIAPLVTAALVSFTPPKIAPQDIKSMQTAEQITAGSYGHAQPTMIRTKDGYATRTSGNRFFISSNDFIENGPLSNNDEYGHGHWKYAGEGNYPAKHNVIPKMPEFAYITGITPLGLHLPNKYDTEVNLRVTPERVKAVDPNRIGYHESKKANFEQSLRSLMFDNINRLNYEASEWIDFLAKKGYSIETTKRPGILGLGIEQGGFAAAYYPKQGFLVSETDFHEKAKNIISRYGIDDAEGIEAMKRAVLLHEFGHVFGVEGDKKEEKKQGLLQAEFYSMMAEKFKGTKMERIYRALAHEGMDYARWYSKFRLFDAESEKDASIDFLIAKFEAEAMALGLSGEKLNRYVSARAYETYGALLEDGHVTYSKKSRNSKKSKSENKSKKDSLEEIVEDSDSRYEKNSEKTYERKLDKSDYKSMKDAKDREETNSENTKEALEAAE